MLLVRLLVFMTLAGIGASLLAWLFTRNPKYLRWARQTFKFSVILAGLFAIFFVLERVILR